MVGPWGKISMVTPAIIEISQHLMQAAHTTPDELRAELAVQLYQPRRLFIGHAREVAGMSLWRFRQLLASRHISPHYDVADLDADMEIWAQVAG